MTGKLSMHQFHAKKRFRDESEIFHFRSKILIPGWDPNTWETYVYYLNTGGHIFFPDEKLCDLLELLKLADMVGDEGLVKRLTTFYDRSSTEHNIAERVFSGEYQGDCLGSLQQRFKEIFLKFWMDSAVVRKSTLEYLEKLCPEESAKARELFCELMAQLPIEKGKGQKG